LRTAVTASPTESFTSPLRTGSQTRAIDGHL
jgi:hypothetical protein